MPDCGSQTFQIVPGFPEDQRDAAARLFWQAFSGKLGKVLSPEDKALALISRLLDPNYALSAVTGDGRLLGMAGYKTENGGLVDGGLSDMMAVYGVLGGLWRGLVLDLLERDPEPGLLLMDGIFVSPDARGLGIGTALLEAVCGTAAAKGCSKVRLDVIDTNPRARALYERCGFAAIETDETGPLKHVFGFSSATRMEKHVTPA
ncbi:GNAT family N-acetyltransferase [Labrenzia sp. PHM005]|uniref:GNAT family N-acetyltransferase n=1 Tax=Labrenzia sp. PHM005 TaxID=2590016 RepID=UPI0011400075|nr:GNAT family N-acetyltransferase [Labrenzia sp. PHM005]QDG75200.1 GNAT family N-acetyltransferase [Labrenzia sp. PHM005]